MFHSALLLIICIVGIARSAVIINSTPQQRFREYFPTPDSELLVEDKKFWDSAGENQLKKILRSSQESVSPVAKNVVIFIGDGMGISTITATRIYKGQRGFGKSGEDHSLVYENFPNVGLVKTYNVDMQVPDSAGTATAIFTGVKTRFAAIGVDVKSTGDVFDEDIFEASKLESLMTWAQRENKDTGIITTTRITHATPAATYSQVNHRKWECDTKIPLDIRAKVKDIARQLVEDAPGKKFKVILGGGYQQLGYNTEDLSGEDECTRGDGLNLTSVWLENHKDRKSVFVTDNRGLENLPEDTEYLLGLFHPDHVPYEIFRDKSGQGTPSLTQMTDKGLKILQKSPEGFVLLVEGGRIDHGHHKNYARVALEESSEFDNAIASVVAKSGPDTLIIVTADHSHTMTLNGYSKRGNDILGYGILEKNDKKPALTLTYANGPGFSYHYLKNETTVLGPWIDVRNDESRLENPEYQHMATFQVDDESHAGEDVAVFATGPGSHLVRGVIEQNYIAHVVSYAACIGPRAGLNPHCIKIRSGACVKYFNSTLFAVLIVYLIR